jgi:hypothetical protein
MKTSSKPLFTSTSRVFSSFVCASMLLAISSYPQVWANPSPPSKIKIGMDCTPKGPGQRAVATRENPTQTCEGQDMSGSLSFQSGTPASISSQAEFGTVCYVSPHCCRETGEPAIQYCPTGPNSADLRSILGDAPLVVQGSEGPVQVWGPSGSYELAQVNRAVLPLVALGLVLAAGTATVSLAVAAGCFNTDCSNGHAGGALNPCMVTGSGACCGYSSACN